MSTTPLLNIWLELATTRQAERWAQARITDEHYLHAPADGRSKPLIYFGYHQATWGAAAAAGPRCIAILIFGRTQAQACYDGGLTYGSQADVESGRARFDRWEIVNLARVWVHRYFQRGGLYCSPDEGLPGFYDRRGEWRSTRSTMQPIRPCGGALSRTRGPSVTGRIEQSGISKKCCSKEHRMATDYNRGIRDALRILAELEPPGQEPTTKNLHNIYIGQRSALHRAQARIEALIEPEQPVEEG